jgi:hypothetical protein
VTLAPPVLQLSRFAGCRRILKEAVLSKPNTASVCAYGSRPLPVLLDPVYPLNARKIIRLGTLISILFRTGSPFTVVLAVPLVVIFALYRIACPRSFTHIPIESAEGLKPRLTDGDASTTIMGVPLVIWVAAPAAHVDPDFILRGTRHPVLPFLSKAPTAFSGSAGEIAPQHGTCLSAIAQAVPHKLPVFVVGRSASYREPSKPFSGKIFKGHAVLSLGQWCLDWLGGYNRPVSRYHTAGAT